MSAVGIRAEHLRLYVIQPTLLHLGERLFSEAAVRLLIGTAAVESDMGSFLIQEPSRVARGIYQIEPATMQDVLARSQKRHLSVFLRVMDYVNPGFRYEDQLIWNLAFATCCCRLVYYLDPAPLPAPDDIEGLGRYWVEKYNRGGKGTVEKFVNAYREFSQG